MSAVTHRLCDYSRVERQGFGHFVDKALYLAYTACLAACKESPYQKGGTQYLSCSRTARQSCATHGNGLSVQDLLKPNLALSLSCMQSHHAKGDEAEEGMGRVTDTIRTMLRLNFLQLSARASSALSLVACLANA